MNEEGRLGRRRRLPEAPARWFHVAAFSAKKFKEAVW